MSNSAPVWSAPYMLDISGGAPGAYVISGIEGCHASASNTCHRDYDAGAKL